MAVAQSTAIFGLRLCEGLKRRFELVDEGVRKKSFCKMVEVKKSAKQRGEAKVPVEAKGDGKIWG